MSKKILILKIFYKNNKYCKKIKCAYFNLYTHLNYGKKNRDLGPVFFYSPLSIQPLSGRLGYQARPWKNDNRW